MMNTQYMESVLQNYTLETYLINQQNNNTLNKNIFKILQQNSMKLKTGNQWRNTRTLLKQVLWKDQ